MKPTIAASPDDNEKPFNYIPSCTLIQISDDDKRRANERLQAMIDYTRQTLDSDEN